MSLIHLASNFIIIWVDLSTVVKKYQCYFSIFEIPYHFYSYSAHEHN